MASPEQKLDRMNLKELMERIRSKTAPTHLAKIQGVDVESMWKAAFEKVEEMESDLANMTDAANRLYEIDQKKNEKLLALEEGLATLQSSQ